MAVLTTDDVPILKPIQHIVRVVARMCITTRENMHLVVHPKSSLMDWVNRGRNTTVVKT